jgi:uncharacterized protein YodC (DUF2158 family)
MTNEKREFQVGDVVYLRGQKNVLMTVTGRRESPLGGCAACACLWFDIDMRLQKEWIEAKALVVER